MTCKRCFRSPYRGRDICRTHYELEKRQQGRYLVDAAPVTQYLARLHEAGLASHQVAAQSGIDWRNVEDLRTGRRTRLQARTARKILSVPMPTNLIDVCTDRALIPAIGTIRRLQALQAMGYTTERLGEECGIHKDSLMYLMIKPRDKVRAEVARAVRDMFNRLQLVFPPDTASSRRAKLRAERRGWVVPLAWDEDKIDDLYARPHLPKRDTDDSWYEDYERLKGQGYTMRQISEKMQIRRRTLQRRLERRRILSEVA